MKSYYFNGDKDRIKEIEIPKTFTAISCRAFSECSSLTNITIPGYVECGGRI